MALPKEEIKTIADIEALPEGTRAELIDGRLFLDTAPTVIHQAIVNFLVTEINIYIRSKGGKCRVFPSPFDVQLSADDIDNPIFTNASCLILTPFNNIVLRFCGWRHHLDYPVRCTYTALSIT